MVTNTTNESQTQGFSGTCTEWDTQMYNSAFPCVYTCIVTEFSVGVKHFLHGGLIFCEKLIQSCHICTYI